MTSLDHNRSRFGFSATLAGPDGPEGAFGQARRNILDRASVRGTTSGWISERADTRHPPPREAYPAKQFNPESPSQPRSRPREPLGPIPGGSWTSPIPKKNVRALQAGIGVAHGPVRLSRVGASSTPDSAAFMRHLDVSFRALRRWINQTQRFHPDAQDPSPSATLEIFSLAFTVHSCAPPPPSRRPPCSGTSFITSLCCLFVLERVAKWRATTP